VTDSINVSFSFQIGGPSGSPSHAGVPAAPAQLYAYAQCEQVALSDATVLLLNTRSGGKMAVTRDVASALTHCTNFETLSDHASQLCSTIALLRGQQADVLKILESARDAGILLGAQEAAARLQGSPSPAALAPTRVFIITCDRPAAVERLLDSLLAAGELSRHDRLVLIDDSRHEDNIRRNRELVGAFNRHSAKAMAYFGAAAAGELLARLLQALPAQAAGLRFLLDRARWADQPTYGLARNLALLLSVGCRALVLDDDILCQAVPPPASATGIGFCHGDAREAWFYPAVPALLQLARAGQANPLCAHADAVGQPLGILLSRLSAGALEPGALAHCNGNLLSLLDGSAPVLMTQCGSAGDPGTPGSKWVTRLGSASVRRLLAQSADEQSLPPCRPCWMGHARPTFSLCGVMSQLTGLDNAQLLPPYIPVMRGEDAVFASMVAFLYPRSAVLNFDWAILHLPLDDRSDSNYSEPFTLRLHLGSLANYLRERIDVRSGGSPASRLTALAAEIRALGECPADTLLAQVALELARSGASSMAALEKLLADDANARHPAWRAMAQRNYAQAREALLAPATPPGDPPDWVAPVQAAALEFAQALQAWPRIREQAATIAASLLETGSLQP